MTPDTGIALTFVALGLGLAAAYILGYHHGRTNALTYKKEPEPIVGETGAVSLAPKAPEPEPVTVVTGTWMPPDDGFWDSRCARCGHEQVHHLRATGGCDKCPADRRCAYWVPKEPQPKPTRSAL